MLIHVDNFILVQGKINLLLMKHFIKHSVSVLSSIVLYTFADSKNDQLKNIFFMKNTTLLTIVALFLLIQPNFAQHSHEGHIRCGTMEYLEWQQQQDPDLESRMEQSEKSLQEWIKNNQHVLNAKDLLVTIPVVVHVVYKTASQNIPDEQILSQIDVLNEDYRRLNSDTTNTPIVFQGVAGDVEIEFCMATTDPDGNPTDGITRTETTVNSFSTNNAIKYTSQGGKDAWPTGDYLNMWVGNLGGGLLGYAQFPNSGSALTDGVVILYSSFGYNSPGGYPYNLGRTATHEVGHWLNLRHIWGDDGGSCAGTDLVNDTPNQGSEYYGCPSFPQTSCSSSDMFMNYMDYTNDACMNIFTEGQKTRTHAAVNYYRADLLTSIGCASDYPIAAFSSDQTEVPVDCGVDFFDNSSGEPISWEWTFDGGTPSTSTEQNPTDIIYDDEGSFTVSLTVENSAGSNNIEIEDYITVGEFEPEVEFEADKVSFCTSSVVTLSDMSTACPDSWVWLFDPSTVTFENGTSANSQNPEVSFDEAGIYSVTLAATNVNGESSLTKNDYLNSGGLNLPFYDDFEDASMSMKSWTVENPDDETTWEISEAEGNEPGVQSMAIYFHDDFTVYERDQLISPVLNLTGVNYAALNFKHAYGQYGGNISDSLIVFISTDCGSSWTPILNVAEDGTGNFATTAPSTTEFFPESDDDWCGVGSNPDCFTVDISPWVGGSDVQLMFESFDLYGNKLYIDDIDVSIFTSTNEQLQNGVQINMFPNPAKETLAVDIRNIQDYVDVQIVNIQGQVIYTERIIENNSMIKTSLNLSNIKAGVYFVRFNNTGFSKTEKLIVE